MDWFGKKAKDILTGFEGIAIGYCSYNTGCNQVLLSPPITKDGDYRKSQWFDEQRIKFLRGKKIVLNNTTNPGPDRMAPTK